MKHFQRWNNLVGWILWLAAFAVYAATAERTVSWWDCGEYISTSGKLMVGHPPGAPTFQILGCIARIFTFGNVQLSAFAVNILSALCSSFTILFLYWTLSMLAGKLVRHLCREKGQEPGLFHQRLIYAASAIGALAYTFSDTFWFSSAEGEVYAMSSFFTALTFWAILKWESQAGQAGNLRWIVFVAFLIGLAIGVHLLNLLVIPAMVYTIYYKNFKHSRKGFWLSALVSVFAVAFILWGIIPWTLRLAGFFEIFFVNRAGLPFHSGTLIFFFLVAGLLAFGLWQTRRKGKVLLNTAFLCLSFLLIGYSSFLTLVIRSNASVPINENEPKDALSLLAYLNREHYGSRPLLYGQYYNARVEDYKEGSPRYLRDDSSGKYEPIGFGRGEYVYDKEHCGIFPRMYSSQNSPARPHVDYYRFWSGSDAVEGTPKPTALENLRFLMRYQAGWMYFRYFMWNFAGRQNNVQGLGYNPDGSRDLLRGNWLSGIGFIDRWRLGPQDGLPDYLAGNPGRNTFFFLPLLLGLCGLFYQYRKRRHDFFVVFLLFFMTGLAIVLYLNQPSTEPRERDYAFAGSFYAFSIWIGLGVVALVQGLSAWLSRKWALIAALPVCMAVPGLMAWQGWDDHDRSRRTAAYDFGRNALLSCEPDAILIANGDNDTFPLWYCQEMEGIRTDVRIVNSALAYSYWHLKPLFHKVYQSDPVRFSLPCEQTYGPASKDYVYKGDADLGEHVDLGQVLAYVGSPNPATKQFAADGERYSVFPVSKVKVRVDAEDLLRKGLVTPLQAESVLPEILFEVKPGSGALYRHELAFLDIFASNKFDRPLHFMNQYAQKDLFPMGLLSQGEGSVYRLVPYLNPNRQAVGHNGINTEKGYDLFVNRFRWGNLQDPKTAVDPESLAYAVTVRYQHVQLARALTFEGRTDSARRVLDKCLEFFPHGKVPFDGVMAYVVEEYLRAGFAEEALQVGATLLGSYSGRLAHLDRFPERFARTAAYEKKQCMQVLYLLHRVMQPYAAEAGVGACLTEIQNKIDEYGYSARG